MGDCVNCPYMVFYLNVNEKDYQSYDNLFAWNVGKQVLEQMFDSKATLNIALF